MIKSTADALLKSLRPEIVYIDEPMNKHTSFKIGGPADVLVMPQTVEDVKCVWTFVRNTPVHAILLAMEATCL